LSSLSALNRNKIIKKSEKFTESDIAVAAVAATQGDFPVYLTGLGTVTGIGAQSQ